MRMLCVTLAVVSLLGTGALGAIPVLRDAGSSYAKVDGIIIKLFATITTNDNRGMLNSVSVAACVGTTDGSASATRTAVGTATDGANFGGDALITLQASLGLGGYALCTRVTGGNNAFEQSATGITIRESGIYPPRLMKVNAAQTIVLEGFGAMATGQGVYMGALHASNGALEVACALTPIANTGTNAVGNFAITTGGRASINFNDASVDNYFVCVGTSQLWSHALVLATAASGIRPGVVQFGKKGGDVKVALTGAVVSFRIGFVQYAAGNADCKTANLVSASRITMESGAVVLTNALVGQLAVGTYRACETAAAGDAAPLTISGLQVQISDTYNYPLTLSGAHFVIDAAGATDLTWAPTSPVATLTTSIAISTTTCATAGSTTKTPKKSTGFVIAKAVSGKNTFTFPKADLKDMPAPSTTVKYYICVKETAASTNTFQFPADKFFVTLKAATCAAKSASQATPKPVSGAFMTTAITMLVLAIW